MKLPRKATVTLSSLFLSACTVSNNNHVYYADPVKNAAYIQFHAERKALFDLAQADVKKTLAGMGFKLVDYGSKDIPQGTYRIVSAKSGQPLMALTQQGGATPMAYYFFHNSGARAFFGQQQRGGKNAKIEFMAIRPDTLPVELQTQERRLDAIRAKLDQLDQNAPELSASPTVSRAFAG